MSLELNEQQKKASTHLDGPCLVTSCPGSGKTFTLVERIIWLIQQGVQQKNILCLTFTNKASNEMKQRVCSRLGIREKDLNFFIGTFHSLCATLIRKLGEASGYSSNFSIIDDVEQFELVSQISRHLEVCVETKHIYEIIRAVNDYRDQMDNFSVVRNKLTNPDHLLIAETYLSYCKTNNLVDFSGLIYEAIQIIENNEGIKDKIQNTFKYILVDETQDTNKSQFYLVNLLGGKWKNIMLIGDIDQSIYRFRGANYKNIEDFIEKYKDCTLIPLSKNYRSTPQIVNHASRLIKYNTTHIDIPFETDNPDGDPVRLFTFEDQLKEAEWVGKIVRKLIDEGGWEPVDIAVLYRINKMSEPIEQAMVSNGIPYEVIGSWTFYDRREVKDCLAMVKFLVNPKDGVSFHRVSQVVSDLGEITVGRIEKIALKEECTIIEACKKYLPEIKSTKTKEAIKKICDIYSKKWDLSIPSECINNLIREFGYKDYIERKFDQNADERKENIEQLRDSAGEYNGQADGLSKYLQQVSLITSSDKENKEGKLSMMSIHAAKGLEFPIVFMIGVENGILPHYRAVEEDEFNGTEEERRLCYVGMTRAKKLLYISWCRSRRKYGAGGKLIHQKCKISPFMKEAGLYGE